ncbi:hypothetical protein K8I61_10780 [bacterium]|nr:hypothetical protein [bacterium]
MPHRTDKHTDPITPELMRDLLAVETDVAVSIYMPTHRRGRETQQDPIRLKNLLRHAEERLARDRRAPEARELLEPARALIDRGAFWKTRSDGLAVFISADHFLALRLPFEVPESADVGRRYFLTPLVPALESARVFYALALDQDGTRLFSCTPASYEEIAFPPDVPVDLATATRFDEEQKSLQFHTGTGVAGPGGRAAMFHGQGAGDEASIKDKAREMYRQIDSFVCRYLGETSPPLVLLAAEPNRGLYREICRYQNLLEHGVDAHPRDLRDEELHARALAVVAELFDEVRREDVARFVRLDGHGAARAARKPEDVVRASMNRRVEALLLRHGERLWGEIGEGEDVRVDDGPSDAATDLVNLAATETMRYGGRVHVVRGDDLPADVKMAAILRY